MRICRWWSLPLATLGLVMGAAALSLPAAAHSEGESAFLLQEHGGVRVMRGLDAGKNFESTAAPEPEQEEDVAKEPDPTPAEEDAAPQGGSGGLVTHRAGGHSTAAKRLTGTQRQSDIRTHQAGVSTSQNIRTHRAGGSDSSKIRTHRAGGTQSSKIRTHRAGASESSNIRTHRAGGS